MAFYQKYSEIIRYIFFGALTTGVNFAVYYALRFTPLHYGAANVAAWAASVLFAYGTNRRYVFKAQKAPASRLLGELAAFAACRLFSGALDTGILILFVETFGINDMAVKAASAVLVIVINYVFSKFFIFKA